MPDEGVEGHFKALLSSTSHGPPRPCPPSPSVPVPPTLPVEPQPLCSLCLRAWEAIGGWRGLRGGRVTEHSVGPGAARSGSGAWPGQIPAASGQSGAPRGPEATHVPRVRQGLPQDVAPDQAPAHAHGRAALPVPGVREALRRPVQRYRAWAQSWSSAALAFPLDLGARPLCRRLRGRGCANCQPRASSAKTRGCHTQLDEGPETP